MHILNKHYENTAPSVWIRQIEGEGVDPATYEIELTETELDSWELRTFRVTDDGRVPIGGEPRQADSSVVLNIIGERRVDQADDERRTSPQSKGRVVTTGKGRKVFVGRSQVEKY